MRKKIVLSCILGFMSSIQMCFGQVSVVSESVNYEVLSNYAMGQQQLIRWVRDADTIYAFRLCEKEKATGLFDLVAGDRDRNVLIVELGTYNSAMITMKSMYNYKGKNKDVIRLNNPSNNVAQIRSMLGSRLFLIADEYGSNVQTLASDWLELMIEKMERIR